jgi:Tfp pilus assembly protein PilF
MVILGLAVGAVWFSWWPSSRSASRRRVHPLIADSLFANTRPGVRYVGDAACVRCHEEITQTYRQHPMGRSLAPIDAANTTATPIGGDEADGRVLFQADGLDYSIERRDGRLYHRETRRDDSGRVVARNEAMVRYVLGSGKQGASYLIDRDGFLFQSPIGWYARQRRWDLSPGYQKNNPHFDRVVVSGCLYCHANRVEPVEGTNNRYEAPIFRGHAIGCERCHGPGELHVDRPRVVNGRDLTIVNPAALAPALRDGVCEQCHLQGHQRVVRRDRRDEDYRPGLSFDLVWSVFERTSGSAADQFVGHVEQMHESRCYLETQGRLGCISCHDPHRLPTEQERVGYYRERCLECHAERGCRLPAAVRREQSRDDDCTGCHMPRSGTVDVIHTATVNHRIPRLDKAGDRSPAGAEDRPRPEAEGLLLVLFHGQAMDEHRRAEAGRDLGLAMSRMGPEPAAKALSLLEAALAAAPDDVPAWQAKAVVLGHLGRFDAGLDAFRVALALEPDREFSLAGAANLAARAKRLDEAIAFSRRVIAINPWRAVYRSELAALGFDRRDWALAVEAGREALRLNPVDIATRRLLVSSYLHLGDREAARAEFQTLLGFDPADRDDLIRRFARLSRP